MDSLKEWLIEVAVKKMGPSAIRGAVLGILGWILTKQNALSSFGIVADQASQTITVHLDQLNLALVAGLPAILAAIIRLFNHQAVSMVPKKPSDTPPPSGYDTPA